MDAGPDVIDDSVRHASIATAEIESWSGIDNQHTDRSGFYVEVEVERGLAADLRVPDRIRDEFARQQLGVPEPFRSEETCELASLALRRRSPHVGVDRQQLTQIRGRGHRCGELLFDVVNE
jgi:hypothetical protein